MNKVFSGVQPTGNLHIGNYLGSMPDAKNIAVVSRVSFLNLSGSCHTVIACKSTTQ